MKTALLAGATGLVGSELLQQLIKTDAYSRIHVLVRRLSISESAKIAVHEIDFENLRGLTINDKIDHVFCALGTTIKKAKTKENFRKVDYDYVVELGKKSKELSAEKFLVISSLGANKRSMIFYNRVKGEMEDTLKSMGLPHVFIFRPSLLLGEREEHRTGEKTAASVYKAIAPIFAGPLKKYKAVEASQVAKTMINTALTNNEPLQIIESDEIQSF